MTLTSLSRIFNFNTLEEDEDNISYDVEFLFSNILVKEAIDFVIGQIDVQKK